MIKEESRFKESTIFEGMASIRAILDNLKENKPDSRKIEKILIDKSKSKSKALVRTPHQYQRIVPNPHIRPKICVLLLVFLIFSYTHTHFLCIVMHFL